MRWAADDRQRRLQRDPSIQARVDRFVHLTHAARAEKCDGLMRAEMGASVHGHVRRAGARGRSPCNGTRRPAA